MKMIMNNFMRTHLKIYQIMIMDMILIKKMTKIIINKNKTKIIINKNKKKIIINKNKKIKNLAKIQ